MHSSPQEPRFPDVLARCAATPELVSEFDRLTGTSLSKIGFRSPIDHMIDEATGFERDQLRQFVQFVFRYVYVPLLGRPMDSVSDCRNEDDLLWYFVGVYGLDKVPTIDELRAASKPITNIDEAVN